jgi:tRNA-dihydrouridine synthase B
MNTGPRIGPYQLPNRVFVAPMAGVTDRPFRHLCKRLGAGYAVSEMITSRPELRDSLKTARRANHEGEPGPIAVQIAGTDPDMMAEAARYNIDRGAQIIDINMGCPAKKVCNRWAGSALMQDEPLALAIIEAVVAACEPHGVPVTLKMRTGWQAQNKNAPRLARAAEQAGVRMLVIHGRTREQGYRGEAEHDTVAAIKASVRIPVVANGDIDSPEKAAQILQRTGVDAVMIGRAAQGRPWLFRDVVHYLHHGCLPPPPTPQELRSWMLAHLHDHYALYGEYTGVRSARKHLLWYLAALGGDAAAQQRLRTAVLAAETPAAQLAAVEAFFATLIELPLAA